MQYSIHTDLAIEASAVENLKIIDNNESGIATKIFEKDDIIVTEVKITNKNGEKAVGKPMGRYVTVEVPTLRDNITEVCDNTKTALTKELKNIIDLDKINTILVVGLGNRFVTPDALGPKVIDKLLVTRHLYEVLPDNITQNMHSLCAVAPGVLGITGIETAEIIKGITDKINPDIIIAIDALASKKTSRISTTFQIADTGIVPGSGIGNKRYAINKESMGVPVIAIGVPTVIEAASVANDAIDMLIEAVKSNADKDSDFYKSVIAFDNENRYKLISDILTPSGSDLIVTPKEVDSLIDEVSGIIADSINEAINGETAKELGKIL
ncbi:MAG: GPR endopeptidase [Clostridia bacterium]|nr:GPR endopeptidase [Clostridia bacterium]